MYNTMNISHQIDKTPKTEIILERLIFLFFEIKIPSNSIFSLDFTKLKWIFLKNSPTFLQYKFGMETFLFNLDTIKKVRLIAHIHLVSPQPVTLFKYLNNPLIPEYL